MEQFIARQPIFDQKLNIYAYELLFRSGLNNYFEYVDGDEASSKVMANSMLLFGIEELTGGTKAFINFTRNLLINDHALAMPKQWTVVEILETVAADEVTLAACQKIKQHGFLLALDDVVDDSADKRGLFDAVDIIKVDFQQTKNADRERLAKRFLAAGKKLLAEKVETHLDFKIAKDLGYHYFQGYFFCQPVIVSRKDIPVFKLQYLRILKEVQAEELNYKRLAQIIQSEASISFKLLKYINSAAFSFSRRINSIEQALNLLGEREVKKWLSLFMLTGMASDKPLELVVTSLIRAKFMELIAVEAGLPAKASDFFLTGLFSMIDAILGRPLDEILTEVSVSEEINNALTGTMGRLRDATDLTIALEQGNWKQLSGLATQLKLHEAALPARYTQAIQWSKSALYAS